MFMHGLPTLIIIITAGLGFWQQLQWSIPTIRPSFAPLGNRAGKVDVVKKKKKMMMMMGPLQMLAASSLAALMGSSPLLVVSLAALAAKVEAITLTVSPTGGNASSPLLYGIMFEVRIPMLVIDLPNEGGRRKADLRVPTTTGYQQLWYEPGPTVSHCGMETWLLGTSPLPSNHFSQAMVESTASCSVIMASRATSPT